MLIVLCVLYVLDTTLAGYRAAAGRNPRVRKERWGRLALLRGFGAGIGVVLGVAALIFILGVEPEPAASAMAQVFVPYAVAVVLAMVFWFSRSLDVRVLASVLVLGPFTLLRPLVIVGGIGWGWWQVRTPPATVLALVLLGGATVGSFLKPPFALPRIPGARDEQEP